MMEQTKGSELGTWIPGQGDEGNTLACGRVG